MSLQSVLLPAVCVLLLTAPFRSGQADEPPKPQFPQQRITAPLDVGMLQRLTLATLSDGAGPAPQLLAVFDRKLDSAFEAEKSGPVTIELTFKEAQLIQSFRVFGGGQPMSWTVAVAANASDLRSGGGTCRIVAADRKTEPGSRGGEIRLAQPVSVNALRIVVSPTVEGGRVRILELNILAEQALQALSISTSSAIVPLNGTLPLTVIGYYSGGETRPIEVKSLIWSVAPEGSARFIGSGRLSGRRKGSVRVSVRLGNTVSPPLPLEVVDAD